MNKIFLSTLLTMLTSLVMAQGGFGAQAGDISVALQLGRAENFNNLQYVGKNYSTYSIYSPSNTTASTSNNSLINMIGVEGKYFLASNIAINISGMGIISASPAQEEISEVPSPASITGLSNTILPAYADVESVSRNTYILNIGGDYYFNVGSERVFPYVGAQVNMNYGRSKFFTLQDDDMGERIAESYGLGGSAVAGIDYYVSNGMFIGLQLKAFSYMYNVAKKFPYPGMEAIDADNHTIGIFSNPMLKIGFKF